ncbi:MAG: hypothetical protein ABH848_05260 [Candidatus Omnitrophota bacterium]
MQKKNISSLIELRKFGFNLALGMNILGCILFYRHKPHFVYFSVIGSTALMLAILWPKPLVALKRLIDKLIFLLNWTVSAVLLFISFYLVFTPVSLLFKLLGKDLLKERIDKNASTYWIKRRQDIFTKRYYERMG